MTVCRSLPHAKLRGQRIGVLSSLLKHTGRDGADNDETRDHQCGRHKSDKEDAPSARRKLPTYNPILHASQFRSVIPPAMPMHQTGMGYIPGSQNTSSPQSEAPESQYPRKSPPTASPPASNETSPSDSWASILPSQKLSYSV